MSRPLETGILLLLGVGWVYILFNIWAVTQLENIADLRYDNAENHGKSASHFSISDLASSLSFRSPTDSPPRPQETFPPAPLRDFNLTHHVPASPEDLHPNKWRPRIMAVVPITWPPENNGRVSHQFQAILDTWGSHVEILRFLVAKKALDKDPPSKFKFLPKRVREELILPVPMMRGESPKERNIWEKMWRTWKLAGTEYLNRAEYFVKVDWDSFLVAENLRVYGSYLNPDEPWYMGHTLFQRWRIQNLVYNSGTCYVLSREALRRLAIRLHDIKSVCKKCGGSQCLDREGAGEDPQTGGCLRDLGILPADTLDAKGMQRFLPFRPRDHLFRVEYTADQNDWFWAFKGKIGQKQVKENCCSPYPIAFHNFKTSPQAVWDKNALHEMEYFFHLAPYESRIIGMDPPSKKQYQYDPDVLDFELTKDGNTEMARPNEIIGTWALENADKLKLGNT